MAAYREAIAEGYLATPAPGTQGAIGRAAEILQVPPSTATSRLKPNGSAWRVVAAEERKAERGELGFKPVLPGYVVKSASTQLAPDGSVEREWVKQTKAPGEPFNLPANHRVKGFSVLSDGAGKVLAKWTKTAADAPGDALVDALKSVFEAYRGRAELISPPGFVDADLLTVYPISDFHAGLYSWAAETGADWDLSIAEQTLRSTMGELVASAPAARAAVVLSLGDFFHADDATNRTPQSGNTLDIDTRRTKVLQIGVRLMIDCVELALAKHERVLVRCLPGNHDPNTTPALAIALWAFFHGNDRVTVDCSPSRFFYHQFGKVMLAATHGDMCKPADMPGVMAATQPKMWGDCTHRYCYSGHVHHRSVLCKEYNGVVCETFQVLPPADAWHVASGYGAGRSMTAITLHCRFGEKLRNVVSICPTK